MKKFKLLIVACLMAFIATESFAAPKKTNKNIETVEFLTDVECEGCVKKVMDYMPFQKGIKGVVVELESKTVTVSYDKRKSSTEAVIELFEKIDVNAEVIEEEGCGECSGCSKE